MKGTLSPVNTFFTTYRRSLKKGIPFAILLLAGFSGVIGLNFFEFTNHVKKFIFEELKVANPDAAIKDYAKYLLLESSSLVPGFGTIVGIIVTVIASVALGIVLFRFIANKKTVNVYYSLGVKRSTLFCANFCAGATLLTLGIVLPLVVGYFLNRQTFGPSPELWSAIWYYLVNFPLLGLLCFGVTAAVFSAVGTVLEGIGFSGSILLAPSIIYTVLEKLMNKLVFGSPYSINYIGVQSLKTDNHLTASLVTTLSDYNPLLFLYRQSLQIGHVSRLEPETEFAKIAPTYGASIFWAFALAVIFAVGLLVFQRRRAEISGFLGQSRTSNALITLLIGFSAFGICATYIPLESFWLAALIGLAAYLLVYLIIEMLLHRSIKTVLKGFFKAPVHLAIPVLVCVVFSTGLFGYSSRVPDADQIESVAISPVSNVPFSNDWYSSARAQEYNYWSEFTGLMETLKYYTPYDAILYSDFTQKEQIAAVRDIHQKIAKAGAYSNTPLSTQKTTDETGVPAGIVIQYTLKDGKTVLRRFASTNVGILEEYAQKQAKLFWAPLMEQALQPQPKSELYSALRVLSRDMVESEDYYNFYAISPLLDQKTALPLSLQQRKELVQALRKDFATMDTAAMLQPKEQVVGYLYVTGEEDLYFEYTQIDNKYMRKIDAAAIKPSCIITQDMKNTIAFFKANDLLESFQSKITFTKAELMTAVLPTSTPKDKYNNSGPASLQFKGLSYTPETTVKPQWTNEPININFEKVEYTLVDAELVADLSRVAHASYFNSEEGYFVKFTNNDGALALLYVAADQLPLSVKNKLS